MPNVKKIVIFSALFLLLVIFVPGFLRLQKLKKINQDMAKKIDELKTENTKLATELKRLAEDPIYQEEVARKKLGVTKKGEVVYKLVPAEAGDSRR